MYSGFLFSLAIYARCFYMCTIYSYIIEVCIYNACISCTWAGNRHMANPWDMSGSIKRTDLFKDMAQWLSVTQRHETRVFEHFILCLCLLEPSGSSRCLKWQKRQTLRSVRKQFVYMYIFLLQFIIVYFPLQVKTKPHDGPKNVHSFVNWMLSWTIIIVQELRKTLYTKGFTCYHQHSKLRMCKFLYSISHWPDLFCALSYTCGTLDFKNTKGQLQIFRKYKKSTLRMKHERSNANVTPLYLLLVHMCQQPTPNVDIYSYATNT
jgi:hypothetical protein